MKNIKIVLLVISGLLLVSCESSTIQDISVAVTNPNYVTDIAPIFSAKCASCHSANGQSPPLNNYTAVKNAYNSYLCKIEGSCGSIMPPEGALPSATIAMIKAWKESGFPENNTSVPIDPIVTTNPNYFTNIAPIFSAKCASCHSANGQSPPLNNYTAVKNAYNSYLCKIEGSCGTIMPPEGALPSATIVMIKNWKESGFLENDTSVPIDPIVITNPKYSSDIAQIFSANCVVCHSANGNSPILNSYTAVKNACQQDGVLCKIKWSCDDVMPPNNKMSQTTIDMIKLWIDQGYIN